MAGPLWSNPVHIVPSSLASSPVSLDAQSVTAIASAMASSEESVIDGLVQTILGSLSIYSPRTYGAIGDGETDDSNAIEAAIAAATAYIDAGGQAATVLMPPGKFLVSRTIVVERDCLHIIGCGGANNLFKIYGSTFVPSEDFAGNEYVIRFEGDGIHPLYGNRLEYIGVMPKDADTVLANVVNGVYWQVARGNQNFVYIDSLTGSALSIQGVDTTWKAHDNHFDNCVYRRCDVNGVEFLGSSADNWFTGCKIEGMESGAGLHNPGAHNKFDHCHWTGNKNHVLFTQGSSECSFVDCTFETAREHGFYVDVTGGGVSQLRIIGCQFDSNALLADNTYDAIRISRSSGSNKCTNTVISNNTFASSETNKPQYHINLSGAAAEEILVHNNTFPANAINEVNHNANSVRCVVDGMGRNVGDPNSTGNWFSTPSLLTNGRDGVCVLDTQNQNLYRFAKLANSAAGNWFKINNA